MVMTCMLGASVYFTYATINGYINTPSITKVEAVHESPMDMPEVLISYNGGMNISAMFEANFSPDLVKVFASRFSKQSTEDINKELENYRLSQKLSMQDTYEKFSYTCEDMVLGFIASSEDGIHYESNGCVHAIGVCSEAGVRYLFNKKHKQYLVMQGGFQITLRELPYSFQNVYSGNEMMDMKFTNDYSIAMQKSFDDQISIEGMVSIPLNSVVRILLNPKRYMRISKSTKCDSRNETYNSATCIQNCSQASYVDACKCRSVFFGTSVINQQQFDYCDLQTEWTCVRNESLLAQCMVSCLPKCDEWVFEYQYSISMFPSKDYSGESKAYISIDYDKMMYIKTEEVEAFTMDMAVANVGGQCGLWLGASFVTLVQAVYYLLLALAEKMAKKKEANVTVIVNNSKESTE